MTWSGEISIHFRKLRNCDLELAYCFLVLSLCSFNLNQLEFSKHPPERKIT